MKVASVAVTCVVSYLSTIVVMLRYATMLCLVWQALQYTIRKHILLITLCLGGGLC